MDTGAVNTTWISLNSIDMERIPEGIWINDNDCTGTSVEWWEFDWRNSSKNGLNNQFGEYSPIPILFPISNITIYCQYPYYTTTIDGKYTYL